MCKIIAFTNTSKIKDVSDFSKDMAYFLHDQRDGFGYAALGMDDKVFGAKTLEPFRYSKRNMKKYPKFVKNHVELFGDKGDGKAKCAMFHGRISTNKISLLNTHPMIKEGHYLIHNGVVENIGDKYEKETQNDSEDVLHYLIKGSIEGVAKGVSGYYACVAISPDGKMHVFKDATAPLVMSWSDKLESFIFASNKKLLEEIANLIDETLEFVPFEDNTYLIFDGNDIVEERSFTPASRWSSWVNDLSSRSIGRSLLPAPQEKKELTDEEIMNLSDEDYAKYVQNKTEEKPKGTITDDDYESWVSKSYLKEIKDLTDNGYYIADLKGNQITVMQFNSLTLKDKVQCDILRTDGTELSPWAFDEEDDMYYNKWR